MLCLVILNSINRKCNRFWVAVTVKKNLLSSSYRGNSDLSQRCQRHKKRVTVRHSLEGGVLPPPPRIEVNNRSAPNDETGGSTDTTSTLGTELDSLELSDPDLLLGGQEPSEISSVTVVMKETASLLRPSLQNLRSWKKRGVRVHLC